MKLSDLEFKPHSSVLGGTMTSVFFDNGFGASIITGDQFYTSNNKPYELAVLKGTKGHSQLTYDTEITDDVMGYLTESEVDKILKKIESLTKIEE